MAIPLTLRMQGVLRVPPALPYKATRSAQRVYLCFLSYIYHIIRRLFPLTD